MLEWTLFTTQGNWAYDKEGVNPVAWTFYFELESDLLTFILRWA